MKNIILICFHGASTGMLVKKMRQIAESMSEEIAVNAYSDTKLGEVIDGADVVLLGPQLSFKKDEIVLKYKDKNVPIESIDSLIYGTMNGKAVLDQALSLIKNNEGEKNE